MVQLGLKAQKGQMALEVQLEHKEHQVLQVPKVQMEQPAPMEQPAQQDCKVQLDYKGLKATKVVKATKV
jgi:hypothetical protein